MHQPSPSNHLKSCQYHVNHLKMVYWLAFRISNLIGTTLGRVSLGVKFMEASS